MRYVRGFVVLLVLQMLLLPTARGTETPQMEEMERWAEEYAPEVVPGEDIDLDRGLEGLLDTGTREISGILQTALKSGILLLVIVLFCALAEGAGEKGSRTFRAAPLVGVLAVCAVSVADVNSLMGLGRTAIDQMADFATILLPTMAAAAAAGGTPASAAARQMVTALFSDVLVQLISRFLIPLTYAYIAASAVHAAVDNPGLKRIAKTLKGVVTGVLTTLLLAFVGYLSVSGAIAGAADAVTVKTAKLAISGMVPVVGGVLSDAAETVLAGAGLLKNAIGVFGTLVILAVCLGPFLRLGVHYLVYKLSATLCSTVSEGKLVELIDAIGGAFALMLGMMGSCAMLLLFSVISCLSAAGVA